MYMELFIVVYSLVSVLIPLTIADNKGQSGWILSLMLFVTMLFCPALCLWAISGLTFGNHENLALVIICLFLPSSLALLIDGEKIK